MQTAVRTSVEQEKVAVGHAELAITAAADGVGLRSVGLGRWIDAELLRAKHLDDLVNGGVGIAGLRVERGILHASGWRSPMHM